MRAWRKWRKTLCQALFTAVMLCALTVPAAADAPFVDNPHWQETSAQTLTELYQSGETFVVMCFRHTCFNSNLRKVMVEEWMERYGVDVYGLDYDQYRMPGWIWQSLPSTSVTFPVLSFVKDGTAVSFTAKDSMRSIQKHLQEHLGIYDESEIDFRRLNTELFANYSVMASTAAAKYLTDASEIPEELREEAARIAEGVSGERERVKAVYDWVTENIYYNYGMLDGTVPRKTSALETYDSKASVCSGYANLTKALCNALGIPCRVVTGFAAGIDTENTVGAVWQVYEDYLQSGDLAAFREEAGRYENHAWNEAYADGRWIILDTTWGSNNDLYPGRGMIPGTPSEEYFDPALEQFSESHLFWTDFSADLTVTANGGGGFTVRAVLEPQHAEAGRGILAAYDSNGRMLECIELPVTGTELSGTLRNAGSAMKLFLLRRGDTPACRPYAG